MEGPARLRLCERGASPRYGAPPATADVAPPADGGPPGPAGAGEIPTPGQIRAARGLAGLSKEELAALADISVSTLNRLEDPASTVRARVDTARAVRRALEGAGVEFIFEPGKKPGVREA